MLKLYLSVQSNIVLSKASTAHDTASATQLRQVRKPVVVAADINRAVQNEGSTPDRFDGFKGSTPLTRPVTYLRLFLRDSRRFERQRVSYC